MIIDLILVVIFLATIYSGYARGLVLSLLSFARYLIGFPLAFFVANTYSNDVYNLFVKDAAEKTVSENLSSTVDIDALVSSVQEAVENIPFGLSGIVDLSFLNSLSQSNASVAIVDNVVEPIALAVVKIVLFVLTIAVFCVITWLVAKLIKKLEKIKHMPLKITNRILGAVFGLFKAVILTAALCAVLVFVGDTFFSSSQNEFLNQVNSSKIIEIVNEYSPLADMI